jgi:hypothetical protein
MTLLMQVLVNRSDKNVMHHHKKVYIVVICLFGFHVTPKQYRSFGDVQALLVEKDLRCPSVNYPGTNGHLRRSTDVPSASWIASSHEIIQSPCRDSNPQR